MVKNYHENFFVKENHLSSKSLTLKNLGYTVLYLSLDLCDDCHIILQESKLQ